MVKLTVSVASLLFLASTSALAQTASWYDTASCKREGTSGVLTASGQRFKENALSCASWAYPFGTKLRITNLKNKKSVLVVVNDRGPSKRLVRQGRTIDLSRGAFLRVAKLSEGVIPVQVEVVK